MTEFLTLFFAAVGAFGVVTSVVLAALILREARRVDTSIDRLRRQFVIHRPVGWRR